MNLMNTARKFGAAVGLGVVMAVASVPSMAAVTTIATTEPLAQIAEGGTAAAAIGLAMVGFVILIGVFMKLRRSGS